MDSTTVIVLLLIVAASIALIVFLAIRGRRSRRVGSAADSHGDDESVRERARAQQEGEASRGLAAGTAYGSGIGGDAP